MKQVWDTLPMIVLLGFAGWTEVTERLDRASGQSDLKKGDHPAVVPVIEKRIRFAPSPVGEGAFVRKRDSAIAILL